MGVVRVDGARLFYHRFGHGRPLLLLHGLGSSGRDWEYQRRPLAQHFELIIPDLRGHGASERSGGYHVERFASDCWALVDQLGHGRIDILGHSMGGAVAMQMALDRPDAVGRLALSNTLPSFRVDTLAKRWLLWTRLVLMGWLGPRRLSHYMSHKLYPRPDQAELRARVARRNARNDRNVYLETVRALTRWSVRERLAELRMPVLVLGAEADYFARRESEAFVTALPDGRLRHFPGTRHGLPLELPGPFNEAVVEFLGA
ncbi:MAG TPA: alpha/beta hydrolase [Verrucomicrobiae bacterium]|nr:alpha/beta hydrolase [Verrucomicrobiae bacterium]